MPNYVYIATNLDGYIATTDGGIDWLSAVPNPDNDDYGYAEFISGIAIVMDRKTFEKVLTFDAWPYTKPVFVLSNSLKEIPEIVSNKVELLSGEPSALVTGASRGSGNR